MMTKNHGANIYITGQKKRNTLLFRKMINSNVHIIHLILRLFKSELKSFYSVSKCQTFVSIMAEINFTIRKSLSQKISWVKNIFSISYFTYFQ